MSKDTSAVRRSNRLRNCAPEFSPIENVEDLLRTTPKNRSPSVSIVKGKKVRLKENNDIEKSKKQLQRNLADSLGESYNSEEVIKDEDEGVFAVSRQQQLYDRTRNVSMSGHSSFHPKEKNKQLQRNLADSLGESYNSEEIIKDEDEGVFAGSRQQQLYHRTRSVSMSGHSSFHPKEKNGSPKKKSTFTACTASLPAYQSHNLIRREQSSSKCTVFSLFAVITAVLLILTHQYFQFKQDNQKIDFDLPKLFPSQSKELWGMVSHGMSNMDPFVVLLVHDDQDDLAKCLAERIVKTVVSERLKHPVDPIFIDGKSVTKDYQFLQNLRIRMKKQTGMVLLHVEDLPAAVAEDLHFILDVHSPWIAGGVYVLTINVPNINVNVKPFSSVQSFLESKWSTEIMPDNLGPLIARVGNFVSVVRPDVNPCNSI